MEKQLCCKKIIFTLFGFVVFWAVVTDAWGYSDWIFRNDPHNIGTYIYGYFSVAISLGHVVVGMLINHKGFWFNSEIISGLVVVKYIVVGFVEETVFRGWGYNSLSIIVSHKKAAIISTIFFGLLH